MGMIIAKTGADMMSGDNNQVLSDYEGTVRLAPLRNLIPDPGMFDFDPATGKHRYWEMAAAPRPTGWIPFVRDQVKVKQFARQTTQPIPLGTSHFDIEDSLVPGASPVDDSQAIAIARPAKPEASVVKVSDEIGFPAGWYTVAYGYITGDNWDRTEHITSPGPRSEPFELSQGMGFVVATPSEIPAAATGLVFFVSEPRTGTDAADAAKLAPMYAVDRYRTKSIEQFLRIRGPLQLKGKFQGDYNDPKNPSYIGNKEQLAGIETHWTGNPVHQEQNIVCQVAYSVYTEAGQSRSSDPSDWKRSPREGRIALSFHPRDFDNDVIGWRPEVRWRVNAPGGENANTEDKDATKIDEGITDWYAITKEGGNTSYFERNERARVYSWAPEKWHQNLNYSVTPMKRGEIDTTGLPAPTEPVEIANTLSLNTSGLSLKPGGGANDHYIKTALFHREDEGPASSQFKTVTIDHNPFSEGIRIKRPMFHQKLSNAELRERDNRDIDIPIGWWIPPKNTWPVNVSVRPPREGVIKYLDTSGQTTDFNAFRTPLAVLEDDVNKFLGRYHMNITGYNKGRVRVYLEEYSEDILFNENAAASRTTLVETHGGNHDYKEYVRMTRNEADSNGVNKFHIAESTIAVRLLVQGMGSGKAGGRNFDVEFSHFGVFEGWGVPRKQDRLENDRGDAVEKEDHEYPHGGYCVVKENPQDAPQYIQYAVLEKLGFENNSNGSWTETITHPAQTANNITKEAALYGTRGLKISKTQITPVDETVNNLIRKEFAPSEILAANFNMFIRNYSAHTVNLGRILDENNNIMAHVRIQANGTLDVVYFNGAGQSGVVQIDDNVEDGEHISVELRIDRSNNTLKVRKGRNEKNMRVVENRDVSWGNRRPTFVEAGVWNSDRQSIYTVYYDNITVTDTGMDNTTPEQGNYIEYYGPHRTPRDEKYGPTGMRIPARPNANYTISCNVWCADVPMNTTGLRVRAMNRKHESLHVFGPVINVERGDERDWERHERTINTPPGTAYLEFFANGFSEGTIRIHGIQLEKGTVGHRFDMANARNGWFSVYFDSRQEGLGPEGEDPAGSLGWIERLRDVNIFATEDSGTSVSYQYRSAMSFNNLLERPYKNDWRDMVAQERIMEVRVNMSSNSDFASPEVRGIELDAERKDSHICRADGTEYRGATLVTNISPVSAPPRSENIELASGAMAEAPWGTKVISRISGHIDAFRRSTAEEIMASKAAILETPWKRYHIRFEEIPVFEAQPLSRLYIPHDTEFFQRYTADFTAWIVAEDNYGN